MVDLITLFAIMYLITIACFTVGVVLFKIGDYCPAVKRFLNKLESLF